MLIESDERLAFGHDITRDAVRASLPVSARRALDRQAADVLLAAGATPVEVATQLAASAEPGDERAIATLFKAAESSVDVGSRSCGGLEPAGARARPAQAPLRGPLATQTAVLLHEAARVDEARAFADTSLREALPAEQEAEVLLSIAGMFGLSPDVRVAAGPASARIARPARRPCERDTSRAWSTTSRWAAASEEARANLAEAKTAVDSSGDADAAFMLDLAEAGLEATPDGSCPHSS